ncbi:MAG TPA: cation-transporting P-type ATPase, partial [Myxococcales bacterium]|nr:cation-transporting P-type ATPase [Myxococcales bacterium]
MLRELLAQVRALRRRGDVSALRAAERTRAVEGLRKAAQLPADELFALNQSGPGGLGSQFAADRLESEGENQVAHERPPAWWVQLWHGFANAFSALLAVLTIVSWVTGDHESAIIIAAMVMLSGLLRFAQERRASLAAQKLQEMVRVTCTVIRQEGEREIPIREL